MTRVAFYPPSDFLLSGIAMDIDDDDARELRASTGDDDLMEVLVVSRTASFECLVACINECPVAVFGIALNGACGTYGIPWAVFTKEMRKHPRELMRVSRLVVAKWTKMFPFLENYVDARNTRSIRWLERLGFTMGAQVDIAPDTPFIKFEKRNV